MKRDSLIHLFVRDCRWTCAGRSVTLNPVARFAVCFGRTKGRCDRLRWADLTKNKAEGYHLDEIKRSRVFLIFNDRRTIRSVQMQAAPSVDDVGVHG